MAQMKIRGNTQILDQTIEDNQISPTAAIQTSKLAEGSLFHKIDGSTVATANWDMGGNRVTNAADGINPQDLVTKAQLDAVQLGLDTKDSVRALASSNVDVSVGGALTIDGVALADGDRVLLTGQTNATENNIYVVNTSGAWTVAPDAVDGKLSAGAYVFVEEGTVHADQGWQLTTNDPIQVGTTSLNWTQFTGAAQIIAGAGLVKSGNTLSVDNGNGLGFNGNKLEVVAGDGTLTVDASGVKLSALNDSYILVGNASNVATGVPVTGDITLSNTGSMTINSGAITNNHIAASAQIALYKIQDGNLLLKSDGSVPMTAPFDFGSQRGVNLADPTNASDAANKNYVDTQIASVTVNYVDEEAPTGAIDGANTTFTLANTPAGNSLKLYLNGLRLRSGASNDYTFSGNTITMNYAPLAGDVLIADYRY